MNRHFLRGCGFLLLMACPALGQEKFETRLAPSPTTTRDAITGEGRAQASLDGNVLTVSGNFHGLGSAATTANLYSGSAIGALGPKAFDIKVSPSTEGSISATVTLSPAQLAAVHSGKFYVQIDSEKAPTGNLTGWLLPSHPFPGEDVPEAGHGFLPQLDIPQH